MLKLRPLSLAILTMLGAPAAYAISDTESLSGAQFNFSNPGARSLGMGGAFIALADDATAAIVNPAGLMQLSSTQFSFELRSTQFDTPFVSGGTYAINPLDRSGLRFGTSSEDRFGIGFAAYTRFGERFSWSVYYHELGSFENSLSNAGVNLTGSQFSPFIDPYTASLNYKVDGFGGAVSTKIGDKFLLGFSLTSYRFEFDNTRTQFDSSQATRPVRNRVAEREIDSSDVGAGIGFLFKPTEQLSFGLSYSRAPSFKYESVLTTATNAVNRVEASFDVPHRLSAGAAYRFSDALTLSFEASRVQYSRLANDPVSAFLVPPDLRAENGTELRLGVEYVMLEMKRPLSVRAGVWRDPAHRVFAADPVATDFQTRAIESINWALFTPGEDKTHFALGLGWAFETFQLDFGADLSDEYDTLSMSGVWRF
jgi:long-chain fatty acid transport protein